MTEADLALKFIEYFEDFDIYKEVPGGGGVIDIVGVKASIRVGIEVKVQLSFEVIWQAFQARTQVHYAYAAAPVKHLHPAQKALCLHLGIGVLAYRELKTSIGGFNRNNEHKLPTYQIEELVKPKLNRRPCKITLHDYMKRSQAGSQSNRMTAFGYFVECFTTIIAKHPEGITVQEIWDKLEFRHYRNISLFRNESVKWVNKGVIKNIEFYKGKFTYVQPKPEH